MSGAQDPVCPNDNLVHHSLSHQLRSSAVTDYPNWNSVPGQFKRGQPGPLQQRPRLCRDHGHLFPVLDSRTDHRQRSTVARSRQSPRITVSQNGVSILDQTCPKAPDVVSGLKFLAKNRIGLPHQLVTQRCDRVDLERCFEDSLDSPAKIHTCRPCRDQRIRGLAKLGPRLTQIPAPDLQRCQNQTIATNNTDQRRTSDLHGSDRGTNLVHCPHTNIDQPPRQPRLVNSLQNSILPPNWFERVSVFPRHFSKLRLSLSIVRMPL